MDNTNYLSVVGGQREANEHLIRRGEFSTVFWYKYGGIVSPRYTDDIHFFKQLCSVSEVGDFESELINERRLVEIGKKTIDVNDGKRFTATISFKGNDVHNLLAMLGKHTHNAAGANVLALQALEVGRDYGVQGALIFALQDKDGYVVGSQVITDVGLKVTQMAGVTLEEKTYTVQLYSEGELFVAPNGHMFVPFMFYDSGDIVNANAPDGALTTFDLKNANGAFGTPPTAALLAQVVRDEASASNPERYIIGLRLNGTKVGRDRFSFNQATGVITMSNAPADGAKLEGIVLLPTGFPEWDSSKQYWNGSVVRGSDGSYYVANGGTYPTTEDPTTGTPADWDVLTDQAFPVPLFNDFDSVKTHNGSTTRYFPGLSWLDFNLNP